MEKKQPDDRPYPQSVSWLQQLQADHLANGDRLQTKLYSPRPDWRNSTLCLKYRTDSVTNRWTTRRRFTFKHVPLRSYIKTIKLSNKCITSWSFPWFQKRWNFSHYLPCSQELSNMVENFKFWSHPVNAWKAARFLAAQCLQKFHCQRQK